MTELKAVLMNRDGISSEDADALISEARSWIMEGADPEEILHTEFGLEPDYLFDLI